MTLTYWKARCLDDADCYSIRTKTKKECLAQIEARGPSSYSKPYKVEVEYSSGFDLMMQCQSEDRLYEDENAPENFGY